MVQGRSKRWQRHATRLAQGTTALLIAANLTLLPQQKAFAAGSLFTAQTGTDNNPFDSQDVGNYSKPTFVDIDGDGKLDAFIGAADGTINYYQNTDTALAPAFTEQTGTDNPLNGVSVATRETNRPTRKVRANARINLQTAS